MQTSLRALVVLGLILGSTAAWSAAQVTLFNNTSKRLCAAYGTQTVESGRSIFVTLGYECMEPATTLVRGVDNVLFLALTWPNAQDYIETQPQLYPAASMWAPVAVTDEYGIEVFERPDGGFSYSYFIGLDDWSAWQLNQTKDGVHSSLVGLGFKRVLGWTIYEASLAPNAIITLND